MAKLVIYNNVFLNQREQGIAFCLLKLERYLALSNQKCRHPKHVFNNSVFKYLNLSSVCYD